jgi:hypothetical protein
MSDQITFTYNRCEPMDLQKDVSFSEDNFSNILQECFEIHPTVTSVDVTFEANPAQATEKFSCAINIHTSGHTYYVKETGEDGFSKIVTQACHKAVKVVRDEKTEVRHADIELNEEL